VQGLGDGPVELQAMILHRGQSDLVSTTVPAPEPVRLTFHENRTVKGRVETPDGQPIAGAIVRFFSPELITGGEAVTGMNGTFAVPMPPLLGPVSIVVLPGMYPARLLGVDAATLKEPLTIVIPHSGGLLAVSIPGAPPWPSIRAGLAEVSSTALLYPRDGSSAYPRGFTQYGLRLDLTPGIYTVCLREECRAVELAIGGTRQVSFERPRTP
jgi:hypothetical protein